MALPRHWQANFNQNALLHVSMDCPYCNRPSTFAPQAQTTWNGPNGRTVYGAIIKCNSPACHRRVYVETTKHGQHGAQEPLVDTLDYYPFGRPPTAHESIPKSVGNDWVEALKAMNVGAITAAAVMCRRVLYGVILDMKCKEHPLQEGIAELAAKIRPPMIVEEWLKEIKEDGHDAAHPSRALSVPADNVLETIEYTRELLRFAYIEPFELKARLVRKATSAATLPKSP
jgi:Domain of unknown function (DUF4145)